MTCQTEDNPVDNAMEHLIEYGFDGVAEAMALLLNTAMRIWRNRYLGAEPYERSGDLAVVVTRYLPAGLFIGFLDIQHRSVALRKGGGGYGSGFAPSYRGKRDYLLSHL